MVKPSTFELSYQPFSNTEVVNLVPGKKCENRSLRLLLGTVSEKKRQLQIFNRAWEQISVVANHLKQKCNQKSQLQR